MSGLFLNILNLAINASWLILAVIAARILLKKAPKWIACLLWGLVAIRLLCPFSLESALSLLPSAKVVPGNIMMVQKPQIDSGIGIVDRVVNSVIESALSPNIGDSVNPMQAVIYAAGVIWAAGVAAMLLYALISFASLKRKVQASIVIDGRAKECDEVRSPFILGILRPVIYVPSGMNKKTLELVIAHEEAHLKRKDHWWKPLGFVLLAVYWFHPLCWVAYVLLCRDIEAACDEKVIRDKDREYMAAYSQALLDCSTQRRSIAACPLAFGETGVKARVKGVLNYKKPAFWVIIVAIAAGIVLVVCFMTNPKKRYDDIAVKIPAGSETDTGEAAEGEQQRLRAEQLQENLEVNYQYSDGNYVVDGDKIFRYKKTLIGRSPGAAYDGVYIVLTNDPDITFEKVNRSIFSSNSADWLTDTIILGMHVINENGDPIEDNNNPSDLQ